MIESAEAKRPAVLTVSEVTRSIQSCLAGKFADVWVRGEITGARKVSSGHLYLSLKDSGAVLPAVMWRSLCARLRFDCRDGLEVVVRGTIDVYPPHGRYQLVVHEVEPLGHGALRLAFEQMRARLEAEGLFEASRKVPIPAIPRRIALVTSKTGAAVRDLVTVIHRRFPRVEIVLVSVRVQGDGAARDVARGLALADAHAGADVIVVGRGGGSLEDLWAFNEEVVARAIAACRTPCVSAVGHEVDVTIADLVADLRAATPSQAGELVVPVLDEMLRDLEHRRARLLQHVRTRVDRAWQRLAASESRPCVREPTARIAALRRHLDHVAARLEARSPRAELARRRQAVADLAARAARGARARLDALASRLAQAGTRLEPRALLAEVAGRRRAVVDLGGRLRRGARSRLELAFRGYERVRAQVEALSPLRVLERGYSLTRVDGALLKSTAQAKPGDALRTQLSDGVVESRVEAVRPAPAGRAST